MCIIGTWRPLYAIVPVVSPTSTQSWSEIGTPIILETIWYPNFGPPSSAGTIHNYITFSYHCISTPTTYICSNNLSLFFLSLSSISLSLTMSQKWAFLIQSFSLIIHSPQHSHFSYTHCNYLLLFNSLNILSHLASSVL